MALGVQDLLPGYWLSAILSGVILLLSMTPILVYVRVGWRAKELGIKNSLGPSACLLYFKAFYASVHVPADGAAAKLEFDRIYDRWYGRRFFLVPGLVYFLTMVLSVVATIMALAPVGGAFVAPNATIAAMAGAFMWCINDQISRSRRLDFSPSDLLWASLRMVTAVPLGYAFDALVPPAVAPFLAFALGAFPLSTLQIILRRLGAKYLGTEDTVEQAGDKIICLQGIFDEQGKLKSDALEAFPTVLRVVSCDPAAGAALRLTMRQIAADPYTVFLSEVWKETGLAG